MGPATGQLPYGKGATDTRGLEGTGPRDRRELGCPGEFGIFRACSRTGGGGVASILRLVKTGADGEGSGTDLMAIARPDGLGDIAGLGSTLSEAKHPRANVQRGIATAQARDHMVMRPDCPRCEGVCHVRDYRDHAVATLFGQITMERPRSRCVACGGTEAGIGWPSHCRSTPEFHQLRAHLSALTAYRAL
jgi:hypothetical protein